MCLTKIAAADLMCSTGSQGGRTSDGPMETEGTVSLEARSRLLAWGPEPSEGVYIQSC